MTEGADTSTSLLASLTAEEIDDLRGCCVVRSFHADDVILREGDHNASLFIVESGTLHASRKARSRRIFLGHFSPGSAFGEVSLFDPGSTTATVAAISDGQLLEIDRASLLRFLERRPAAGARVLLQLLAQMAQRLRRTDTRLADSLLLGSARER